MNADSCKKVVAKHSGQDAWPRAKEKQDIVLRWLWHWRHTNARTVMKLLDIGRSRAYETLARLADLGLIQDVPLPVGQAFILTVKGSATIRKKIDSSLQSMPPLIYPSRVNFNTITHDLIVAELASVLACGEEVTCLLSDPDMRHIGLFFWQVGFRRPDIYAELEDGSRLVFEIEENSKASVRDFDRMISLYGEEWNPKHGGGRITHLYILSTDKRVVERAKTALELPGFYGWNRDANRRWYLADYDDPIPDPYRDQFRQYVEIGQANIPRQAYYAGDGKRKRRSAGSKRRYKG